MKQFDTLYKKAKSGKIQIWSISCALVVDKNAISILIAQGQYSGKLQKYEEYITEGKQNRNIYEQAELEAQSRWNKKKDEGYKSLPDLGISSADDIGTALEGFLLDNLFDDRTDANGVLKPMKCTPIEKGLKKIKFPAFAQPKLDGVRGLIRWDGEQWRATSSSGKSYDVMARHILYELDIASRENEALKEFILDGEFYIHGVPLEFLSGWARTKTPILQHLNMKFHLFDLGIKEEMHIRNTILIGHSDMNSFRASTIEIVQTQIVNEMRDFNFWHDVWVSHGYEGAILRNFDGIYEFGIRSTSIFKKKDFKDEEFEIVGMELGSRGTEDMVFWVITKEGKRFKANPVGNRQMKDDYWNNQLQIIGKQAMVRYLTVSQNGIPQGNPVMKTIRDYE